MCQHCDQPGLTTEQYDDEIRQRQRFMVQGVGGSARSAEYSYTVGLTAHLLPELVLTGLRHETAVGLLLSWDEYLLDDSLVLPGETLESGGLVMQALAGFSWPGPTRAASGRGSRGTARARLVSRCSASERPPSATSTGRTGSMCRPTSSEPVAGNAPFAHPGVHRPHEHRNR